MFSSAARTIVSRAAASSASRGAVANRLNVQPSMMAVRFGSVSLFFICVSMGVGWLGLKKYSWWYRWKQSESKG
eukprot:scaffold546_cov113-Skeletonema_dohrnii-CCMP3373.AAC.4